MKKIIILTLAVLMMVGCINQEGEAPYVEKSALPIIEYDSCEYIKCYTYGFNYYVYSHKGNCRFCKERRQKELKELVEQLKEK